MTPTSSFYSVVVLGGMNPRIHSPGWYRLVELISTAEYEHAIASTSFSIPPMARVQLPGFEIQCQEGRWEVQTNDPNLSDRLADIAGKVFDVHLKHTSVTAYGFNFNFTYESAGGEANRVVLKALKGTGLASGLNDVVTGEFSITRNRDRFQHRIDVTPVGENAVVIGSNYHHPIINDPSKAKAGFFDIGGDMKDYLAKHREEALQTSMDYAQHLGLGKTAGN